MIYSGCWHTTSLHAQFLSLLQEVSLGTARNTKLLFVEITGTEVCNEEKKAQKSFLLLKC